MYKRVMRLPLVAPLLVSFLLWVLILLFVLGIRAAAAQDPAAAYIAALAGAAPIGTGLIDSPPDFSDPAQAYAFTLYAAGRERVLPVSVNPYYYLQDVEYLDLSPKLVFVPTERRHTER